MKSGALRCSVVSVCHMESQSDIDRQIRIEIIDTKTNTEENRETLYKVGEERYSKTR